MKDNVLYEDKFVSIFKDHLLIKWYVFPFASSKRIDFTPALTVTTDKALKYSAKDYKVWGTALIFNNVWWACDCSRFSSNPTYLNIVCSIENDGVPKGFSIERPESALPVLEKVLNESGGSFKL